MDEELKEFIEENIELIDSKQFKKLYDNFHNSKIASWMLGRFTQSLWDANIHPEFHMNELPLWFTHTNSKLKEFTVPANIKKICDGAFGDCRNLESLILAEGVELLGNHVLSGCKNVKKLSLPKSLKYVGDGTFWSCWHIADELEIVYNGTITDFEDIYFESPLMQGLFDVICTDGIKTVVGLDHPFGSHDPRD